MQKHQVSSIRCITFHIVSYDPDKVDDQNLNHDAAYDVVQVARQTVLQSHAQHHVLFTRKLHSLLTIESRAMSLNRHSILTSHGIIVIPPGRPFYIFVSHFSDCKAYLPKHMIIANTVAPPHVIHTIDSTGRKVLRIGTTEVDIIGPKMNLSYTSYLILNRSLQLLTSIQ